MWLYNLSDYYYLKSENPFVSMLWEKVSKQKKICNDRE